jgi:hypothetical protein
MKIPKDLSFRSSPSKDNDLRSCQHRGMSISWSRWSTRNLRFSKFIRIHIQDIRIVEVCITLSLSRVVMPSKDNNRCPRKRSRMPTPRTRTNPLDNRIRPLPPSYLQLVLLVFLLK